MEEYTPKKGDKFLVDTDTRLFDNCSSVTSDTKYIVFTDNTHFDSYDSEDEKIGSCYGHDSSIEELYKAGKMVSSLKSVTNTIQKIAMGLLQTYKNITRSEPEKTFIKAGVMNENSELTPEGNVLFTSYLLGKYAEGFKTDIVDKLVAEMEAEKK